MSRNELLELYKSNVEEIRKYASNCNISDEEIDGIFQNCLKKICKRPHIHQKNSYNCYKCASFFIKIIFSIIFLSVIIYITLNVHQATSSIVLRNVQSFIYPGLKLLRFLSVPIISKFPWMTSLYDESCLVHNPFFFVNDMECWPCENVHSVLDITGVQNKSIIESGIPYLVFTNQKVVTFSELQAIYNAHKEIFDSNAYQIKSSNSSIETIRDLFFNYRESTMDSKFHATWRINRMAPAKLIRKVFPRPQVINRWSGQSIERFIFMDGPHTSSYLFPNPECSYVFLIQGSGNRNIILKPTMECSHSCKTISVILHQSQVLWYNWWYWRPLSLPVKNSTEVSVTYMNSYC
ncbi:uncharacterized protein LOC112906734 [Agrilus planipennis]|uniref:Uncharacterized protein LOC108743977 n=1 Tax=Agrilus planipennis TaxID=224129 RepID=A0A1W4XRP4_AGRPL|nr:uncharacterized protein LOC108743977 [Agrilus planipennis]XP_025837267.1 uncharacterized protein LOC112906734 [Agrilus planipennis]